MKKIILLTGFSVLFYCVHAQDLKETKGVVWHGQNGIEVSLQQILEKQQYMETHHLLQHSRYRRVEGNEKEYLRQKQNNPNSPKVAIYKDPNLEETQGPQSSYTIALSFDAVKHGDITQGWLPPDPMVACGPKQLIVSVNGRFRVFDKSGNMQYDIDADVFFQDVRGGSNAVDPRIRYDAISKRWFVSAITIIGSNNRVLLAVSSSAALTRQTTFYITQFQQNKVGPSPNIDDGLFADYETLGVDANAVYIGCNMFNASSHTSVFVIKKSDLINGTLTATAFRNIGNYTSGGPWTPQGVSSSDPNAAEGYFIGTDYNQTGKLVVRRISNPGGIPSISGNLNITVPSTSFPLDVPNKNGYSLASVDARLLLATINKNNITGKYTLWCSHSIAVNSSGVGTSFGDRDAVRWYEIGNLTTTPTLVQAGTLFDNAAATPKYFWMGTISMNGNGDALISCSVSANNIGANGAVAAHYAAAGGGTTSAPLATTNNQTGYFGYRWGDYSASVVDPNDNSTFWACHEYIMNGDYVVKIAKVIVANSPQSSSNTMAVQSLPKWLVNIAPNPATNNLHVTLSEAVNENLYASVTDLYGIKFSEKIIQQGTNEWNEDIIKLKHGFYFMSVTTKDGSYKQSVQFEKK